MSLLALTRYSHDMVLVGGVALLVTFQVLSPADALNGFANEGVATVGVLFAVVCGLNQTGAVSVIARRVLGHPHTEVGAQARLVFPVAALSTVLNNTPLVSVLVPIVLDWSRRIRIAPSKLLILLSFASILGGLCTLSGTSTNLLVNGLLIKQAKQAGMNFLDPAWVGIPCALVGLGFLLAVGRWLLPNRSSGVSLLDDPRQYTVEMEVEPKSAIEGLTIEQAGLRHLPGLFLVEIERAGQAMPAVSPEERLQGGDRLVFAGVVDSVVDLQRIRGLKLTTDQVFKLNSPRSHRCLIEAVVASRCPLVGQTVRQGRFRSHYNAAIIAVAREGARVNKKIGDIVLHPGDTLLLEAHPWFLERYRDARDFYLLNQVKDSTPARHERAWVALTVFAAMVVLAASGVLSMFNAALLAAGAMILTRCCTASQARRAVDWQILIAIAACFGIGRAMELTGAASVIVKALIEIAGDNPWFALAAVYAITMICTELMSNNAAAVLVFPFALATAHTLQVNIMPFVMAIIVAASCGFATPIGYQTHLMVYSAGGYRFADFLKIGVPLNLLIMAVTISITPLIWPF